MEPPSRPFLDQGLPVPIFLTGPTASGKSAVALRLAERLGGEIISVDSMQVYRGMDIGTDKPTAPDRQRIQHHLIDVVDLSISFNAAMFASLAATACREIQSRGRIPILAGGTGLYFKAYWNGLGDAPPPNTELRAELEDAPLADLIKELSQKDPVTFQTIDPRNRRRIVRAVEAIRLSGRPFSQQRAPWKAELEARDTRRPGLWIGLQREAADLRERITKRVERMLQAGLVEETRTLISQGLERNRTAAQAIGYRQIIEFLREKRSLEITTELIHQKTRQFAKRQMTWFRHQLAIEWMPLSLADRTEEVADRIAGCYLRRFKDI